MCSRLQFLTLSSTYEIPFGTSCFLVMKSDARKSSTITKKQCHNGWYGRASDVNAMKRYYDEIVRISFVFSHTVISHFYHLLSFHRSVTIVKSYSCVFTIVRLRLHHRTIALSPSLFCVFTIVLRIFIFVLSLEYRIIACLSALSSSCYGVVVIVPSTISNVHSRYYHRFIFFRCAFAKLLNSST